MSEVASTSALGSAPSYAGPWSKLKPALHPALLSHVVDTLGFQQMTPVQSGVIPLFLSHKDVIVEAVTGSGKTLAYVLPVLQMLATRESRLKKSQIGAIIVCPTRELAIQIYGVIQSFIGEIVDESNENGAVSPIAASVGHALLAVGGSRTTPSDDYKLLKEQGSDIVVGTPGRLEELLKRPSVDTKELEVLVLDEADRLLDLGFQNTITSILHLLPRQRRTGLFSATMTDALGELVRVGLRNPVRVVVKVETKANGKADTGQPNLITEKRMPATLENYFATVRPEHRTLQMVRILRREAFKPAEESPMRKAVVYFATCAQVNYFYKVLAPLQQMQGLKLYSLHGKQAPTRRTTTFNAFVNATPLGLASSDEVSSVLLCTDVAARGLDLPNVDLVIQFDPPTDPKVFSHRCGRTARAGRKGKAVVMLNEGREEEYVEFLKIRKIPMRPYGYFTADSNQHVASDVGQQAEETDAGAQELCDGIRTVARTDRAIYEAAMQAFVSFIQCYRKHEVSFVFRERDLDYGALAFAFGLLRLPRMPEVDRWRKAAEAERKFVFHEETVDLGTYAYADKLREQQRMTSEPSSKKKDAAAANKRKPKPALVEQAWSDQKDAKERRQVRREKKQRKRAFLQRQAQEQQAEAVSGGGKASDGPVKAPDRDGGPNHDEDGDDQQDWAEEERSTKKAKKAATGGAGGLAMDVAFDL